jgi:hypothetical protein
LQSDDGDHPISQNVIAAFLLMRAGGESRGISFDQGGRVLAVGLAAPQVLFPHARG